MCFLPRLLVGMMFFFDSSDFVHSILGLAHTSVCYAGFPTSGFCFYTCSYSNFTMAQKTFDKILDDILIAID